MGIVKLPAIDDYWKKDPLLHYEPVSSKISRDRYREIRRYIHFVDNTTLGARVVKDLTKPLRGKFHHVYFDNFFTSVKLLEDLEKDGLYACGTARSNRVGFPQLNKVKLSQR